MIQMQDLRLVVRLTLNFGGQKVTTAKRAEQVCNFEIKE